MNDQQRAVMQMALEDLEHSAWCVQNNYLPDQCGHDWDDTITALREALQEHALQTLSDIHQQIEQPQGEPVAWVHKSALHWISDAGDSACVSTSLWKKENEVCNVPLYTTPPSVEAAIEANDDDTDKALELVWHMQSQIDVAVKAAIEETKEKAAKLVERFISGDGMAEPFISDIAAAIRSMK